LWQMRSFGMRFDFKILNTIKMKIHSIALALGLLLSAGSLHAQKFPEIKGHTLAGKEVTLPNAGKGKFLLLGIAQTQKAQADIESWLQPLYASFMENSMYPTVMYVVPMTGGKIVGTETIEKKLRQVLDTSYHNYVLVYSGDPSPIRKQLNMEEKDKGYIFVVDPRGDVIYKTSGKYSDVKLEEMTDKMSD
jgi:uncharacterized membrane protein (UPF0182 family)